MASRGAKLVKDPTITEVIEVLISSITVAVGDILYLAAGSTTWALGTSSTVAWQKKGVAVESATTSDTLVKILVVNDSQSWDISTNAESSKDDNGDRMILTDEDAVNNTGTDSAAEEAVVVQEAPIGSASEKRALFRFMDCSGVDPDAS